MLGADSLLAPHKPRILIVDDHPHAASLLAQALGHFEVPVEILIACDGSEAIDQLSHGSVDVLITDFMMPHVNGLELIERIRQNCEPTYTILMTAYDIPSLGHNLRRLCVDDYLVKPVHPDKLRALINRALAYQRQAKFTAFEPAQFKVLIADDRPDNVQLLVGRLSSEGYTCLTAENGLKALQIARAETPDLALMDVNMPGLTGLEVLLAMRRDVRLAHVPVILITANHTLPRDVEAGFKLGADDYVIKPFDWHELLARVRAKLRAKQTEDLLRQRNQELTELNQALHQNDLRLRAIVQDVVDPIIVLDGEGNVALCNSAAQQVFPKLSHTFGQPLPNTRCYSEIYRLLQQASETGLSAQAEMVLTNLRTFTATVTPLLQGWHAVVLREAKLEQSKAEFMTLSVRDFPNAISLILTYSDLLSRVGPLTERQREYVTRIYHSTQSLYALTQNMQELARLTWDVDLQMEPCDLHALCSQALLEIEASLAPKTIEPQLQLPAGLPNVLGEADQLRQVLSHVLTHVASHTPTNSCIWLSAEAAGAFVHLSVRGTSAGIPAAQLPNLFSHPPNAWADDGLSHLAIVRSIVERHGGYLTVESDEDHGCCFRIALIAAPPVSALPAHAAEVPPVVTLSTGGLSHA